jgi:hypothetical protein
MRARKEPNDHIQDPSPGSRRKAYWMMKSLLEGALDSPTSYLDPNAFHIAVANLAYLNYGDFKVMDLCKCLQPCQRCKFGFE